MSDLDNLFEENTIKDEDTDKSRIKSITDRFKVLIENLYILNIIIIVIATIFAVAYISDERYIDNVYIIFALFGGFILWVIHELTFGMITTVIDIRDGIAKLNSKEDSQ